MSVKIRLTRKGGKKHPFYRIVAADSDAPRDGSFLEVIGSYNPMTEPPKVEIKTERLDYWVKNGALLTDTVRTLVKARGAGDTAKQ
jgi:small subunit ribosomal protein S16